MVEEPTAMALDALSARLARVVPPAEIELSMPLMERIVALKRRRGAAVLAHNYQVPLIAAALADFTGDSLAMARFAVECGAETLVVCGVRFMAETVKLLCPDQRVLLPSSEAGCSLADSITVEDVRRIRERCPGVPVIAYVNTSAAVKAEADICCTSANAARVARSLGSEQVIVLPDRHLAEFVARGTDLTVIAWHGECEVHTRFSPSDIRGYRVSSGATVLAHPECPAPVQAEADFVGSTAAMADYLRRRRPARALLLTECARADNVAVQCPDIAFLRPCNLCPHMKATTLERLAFSLEALTEEIHIDPLLAERARRPIERMLALG